MEEEFNSEAAGEFQEEPQEPQQDLAMLVDAIIADTALVEKLSQALAPMIAESLGLTGASAPATDEAIVEEDEA